MAHAIGRAQKLGKQNKKRLDNTTNNFSSPSNPSYSYNKLNENTNVTTAKKLTIDTHYSTTFYLDDKPSIVIQTEPVPNPHKKDTLISTISVGNDAQSFAITRINNCSVTAPRD